MLVLDRAGDLNEDNIPSIELEVLPIDLIDQPRILKELMLRSSLVDARKFGDRAETVNGRELHDGRLMLYRCCVSDSGRVLGICETGSLLRVRQEWRGSQRGGGGECRGCAFQNG